MKDFALDEKGDIIISNGDIQYTADNRSLLIQKIRMVLGTNKGEWSLNKEEGVNYRLILAKNPSQEQILDTVQDGLYQVDETLRITSYNFEIVQRKLILHITASNDSGEDISFVTGTAKASSGVTVLMCALDAKTVLTSGSAIEALAVDAKNLQTFL